MKFLFSLCACAFFVVPLQELNAQQLVKGYKAKVFGTPYHKITGDAEGNSLVYGHFDHIDGEYVGRLARITASGKVDPGFQKIFADGTIDVVRIQSDHKIFISGRSRLSMVSR